eukprot:RCo028932
MRHLLAVLAVGMFRAARRFAVAPWNRSRLNFLEYETEINVNRKNGIFREFEKHKAAYEAELLKGAYEHSEAGDPSKILELFKDLPGDEKIPEEWSIKLEENRFGTGAEQFCTRLLQAQGRRRRFFPVLKDEMNVRISEILLQHGMISSFREYSRLLAIEVKYFQDEGVIKHAAPISLPSRRIFYTPEDYFKYLPGRLGFSPIVLILHTDDGVMSHLRAARQKLSGEALMWAW